MKFLDFTAANYSNVKKSNCKIFYPKNNDEIKDIFKYVKKNKKKILCIGSSQSWFDTILNSNNVIINLKHLKKIFNLNKKDKILTVSSSYKIKEILENINQHGLSLFSIPGSLDVTIGGCVANDVHGKDSYKYGNFGENIIEIEIMLSSGELTACTKDYNSELFTSVIGGLGLMGVITKIKLNLKEITNFYEVENFNCDNYQSLITTLYNKANEFDYVYGWVDLLSKNKKLGRGVVFKSKKIFKFKELNKSKVSKKKYLTFIKSLIFMFCTKLKLISYLNSAFYYIHMINKKKIISYEENINTLKYSGAELKQMCPPNSFFDVQVILKKETLPNSLYEFINKCQDLNLKGSIIGIKMHKKNNNYLSFSDDGVSINITTIFKFEEKNALETKFKELYQFIIKNNYKVYIAKDFFFDRESFFKNYENANKFFSLKQKYDKDGLLYSDFLKRIEK